MSDSVKKLRTSMRMIAHAFPSLRSVFLPLYKLVDGQMWPLRQLVARGSPIEVSTRHGSVRMLAEGHIAEEMWRSGFEEAERDFVERYLKPGMCVLNVGANSGLYTVLAARIVGQGGEVHAFEPASENVLRLRRNVALNELSNVSINQCAVSDAAGVLDLCRDPTHPMLDSHYSVHTLGQGRSNLIERVEAITLDGYWRQYCRGTLRPIDMIIIDVEGAELKVIAGAMATLEASPSVMIMAECTERLDELERTLGAIGFTFHLWDPSTERLLPTPMQRGNLFISRGHYA